MDDMIKLEAREDVEKIQTDMCQFGMVSRTGGVGSALGPVLKPTGFLKNFGTLRASSTGGAPELMNMCLWWAERPQLQRFTRTDYAAPSARGLRPRLRKTQGAES